VDYAYAACSLVEAGRQEIMKAAIYCRLSEEDRDKRCRTEDSASILNQKEMLIRYAAQQGWELYNIYSDEDYAGADRSRPAFNQMLQDAREHKFDVVLCKSQSRFTRELELVEKYIHGLFPAWGIRFVSIVDNADTASKGNKKSRQINGLVNEWYLEDMSENIRSVLDSRRMQGYHIGSFALYGYRKSPDEKGRLIVDEEAAEVVREVFALFAGGVGKTAIARLLNARGIPNPTEYKRLCELRYRQPRNSTRWSYSTVSHMLANEMYIGNMVQGKCGSVSYKTKQNKPRPQDQWIIVPGTHEGIVDQELWESVQRRLKERSRPFAGGTAGLFAGKARCMFCGSALHSSQTQGRRYLKCNFRYAAPEACPGAFISVDRLEAMVMEELNRLTEMYLDVTAVRRTIESFDEDLLRKQRLQQEMENCRRRMSLLARASRNAYADRIKGMISQEDYDVIQKQLSAETELLERTLALAGLECEKFEKEEKGQAQFEGYLHPAQLSREMVDELIDFILIGKRIPQTRNVPVEIHWRF